MQFFESKARKAANQLIVLVLFCKGRYGNSLMMVMVTNMPLFMTMVLIVKTVMVIIVHLLHL